MFPPETHDQRQKREVSRLLEKVRSEASVTQTEDEELHAKTTLRLREKLSDMMHGTSSCASCSRHLGGVEGVYPGGLCCSGTTADVFNDDEIALVSLGRPRKRDFPRPDREAHAGCAFRGSSGCTLGADTRPSVCIHYVCRDLMKELGGTGKAKEVGRLQGQLEESMGSYQKARAARVLDDDFNAIFE